MMAIRFAAAAFLLALFGSQTSNATTLYSNGPVDGQNNAFLINFDYAVADSFVLGSKSLITGVDFTSWFTHGAMGVSVDWAILSASPGAGGVVLESGTAVQENTFLFTNSSTTDFFGQPINGFDIYNERLSLAPFVLDAGTYWLQLMNAVETIGDPQGWDTNGGPSSAFQNDLLFPADSLGDITSCPDFVHPSGRCSETFDVTGTSNVPEPATLALLSAGLAGLGAMRRRRRSESVGKASKA